MYKVVVTKNANKELLKINKGNQRAGEKILALLDVLGSIENPLILQNAKKLQGKIDNQYRWRVGEYRIIGIVENEILLIQIIKIAHRQEAYD